MNPVVRRKPGTFKGPKPEILAPAGSRDSFLAALAAGADAIYCGLKSFSARMAARNFTIAELAGLIELAHQQGRRVYLTLNTLVTPDELLPLGRQIDVVQRHARPDGLIVQDIGVVALARQAGYDGEIHLSTLANVTTARILARLPKSLGVNRVVLPRELNVDEVKQMAAACPPELGLEIFVHGALCYAVSGRCYWSSYLGGKSGLRGRCVQPCRRNYTQNERQQPFFSCQDLSLDTLVKVLAEIPQIRAWKIEGRKKGPHYVYYTTAAYQMLRDEGQDPQVKKAAIAMLEQALGRPGTHYHFLPQRPWNPIDPQAQPGSGLLAAAVHGGREKPYIQPRMELLAGDRLRVGYEGDVWHQTLDLTRGVPKGGKFYIHPLRGQAPANGTPVFLIDRREPQLAEKLVALQVQLDSLLKDVDEQSGFGLRLPPGSPRQPTARLMHLRRLSGHRLRGSSQAVWLSPRSVEEAPTDALEHIWWWLPPVIWPAEEEQWQLLLKQLLRRRARRFVLNTPWQAAMFGTTGGLNLWAGPFCNIANPLALRACKLLGCQGAIVSPELSSNDLEALAARSVLPLGVVISGHWPLCVSRVLSDDLATDQLFTSPQGEQAWARQYEGLNWVYPNWPIDLRNRQDELTKFGYRLFVHIDEPVPRAVTLKKRAGQWNYELGLK